MATMIKLRLTDPNVTLDQVRALPGMDGLDVDESYGLICVSPKRQLFVVRVKEVHDIEQRKMASPEILEAYGDVRISTIESAPSQ